MEKRMRSNESCSPENCPAQARSDKKIKLSTNVDAEIDADIDVDSFFDDCSFNFMEENLNNENRPDNSQDNDQKLKCGTWHRLNVKSFEIDPKKGDLKVLLCREEMPDENILCRLQGIWAQTKIETNEIVSVLPVWDDTLHCYTVTNNDGFFVTYPDSLISGTTVVGSLFCQRKSVLQEKFRGIDAGNKLMVIGTIVHQLLQTALQKKATSLFELQKIAKQMVNSRDVISMLFASKMSVAEIDDELNKFIPKTLDFIEKYITMKATKSNKDEFDGTIEHIRDIEENIWIPQLGLKGKIDLSVKIYDRKKDMKLSKKNQITPLELKTGRATFSLEHRGQVILYQMMLKELGFDSDSGLLLYLREGIMKDIPAKRNEQRDLIVLRNDMSYYLTRNMQLDVEGKSKFQTMPLPEPINHHSACSKCAYATICTVFLKTDPSIEISERHPLNSILTETSTNLQSAHIDYFIFWCGLISLEQEEINKSDFSSSLWVQPPEKRVKHGRALINLRINGPVVTDEDRYIHKFVSQMESDVRLGGISIGEYVIISTAKRISIAAGSVCDIAATSISVRLERDLRKNYANDEFIIDKYESKSGNIFNFTNLGMLLENVEHYSHLREIIVDKKAPTFAKTLPAILAREGKPILKELNKVQQSAVLKALSTDSYILIKGLPGTGKTQTLVAIIRLLHLLNKSVIITSHTHSAVDNVLLRLKQHKIPFLRLGSESRIHPDLMEYSEYNRTKNCTAPEELEKVYKSYSIVGVTCLGSGHPFFSTESSFDVCIVDEATQVYQPTVFRPLFFAKKFILVGDPDQLPPLVHSDRAKELGADESLFHRLDSPNATTSLTLQYRMNKVITKLANDLTYNNVLECGNENVMSASLNYAKYSGLLQQYSKEKWILKALEKHIDQSVVFLDTKSCLQRSQSFRSQIETHIEPHESITSGGENLLQDGNSNNTDVKCSNYCEAAIVFVLAKALIYGGYQSNSIGIITPYRAQVQLLKNILEEYNQKKTFISNEYINMDDLEINTVDQYQGRDKEIIIYSCAKNLSQSSSGNRIRQNEILQDRRRLTVAITRSKRKLILIGDHNTLTNYTPFADLLSKIPNRCKIMLEDGNLGFNWNSVLTEIKNILSS